MSEFLGEKLMKELLDCVLDEHNINNYKPSWLNGLELDRYYPSLRTAFEFQGKQHFEYSFVLHKNHQDFITQYNHDLEKKRILKEKKIYLIELDDQELELNLFFNKISFLFFTDLHSEVPLRLMKKIKRYQKGLDIYYRKQLNSFLLSKDFNLFTHIPSMENTVAKHLHLSKNPLNSYTKYIFCLLCLLSEENEVQFSLNQLNSIFPDYRWNDHIDILLKNNMISIDPHYLIKIDPKFSIKTLDFIEKLVRFAKRKLVN